MPEPEQAAALWLGKVASVFDVRKRRRLRDLARHYSNWSAVANGSELDREDDPDSTPHERNQAYFDLLARCLSGLTIPRIDELCFLSS